MSDTHRYGAMNQLMEWFGLLGSKMSDTPLRGHEPTNGVVWFIGRKMSDHSRGTGPCPN